MKDQGINKALFQDIETDNPKFKGFQSIRKLFWKYLNILGVPFTDPCCESASTATGGGLSYKVYTALLTQSGTDAPVATVLENTLGGTVVWTRQSAGIYNATLVGAFTENKTYIQNSGDWNGNGNPYIPIVGSGGVLGYYSLYRTSVNTIQLHSVNASGVSTELSTIIDATIISLPKVEIYP